MQVATQAQSVATSNTSSPSVAAVQAAVAANAADSTNPTMTQLILEHPLYPLLQMVFQKCELATSSPRDSQTEAVCSSESFKGDIESFIRESNFHNRPLTTGVRDVDRFMLKSIEVLRIHLLELEKVHQLCDNFCQRYISCLKGKLPTDLVVDDGSSRDTNSASRNGNQQDGSSSYNNNNNSSSSNNNNNNSSNNNNTSSNNNNSSSSTPHNGQSNNNQNNSSSNHDQSSNNGHHHHTSSQHHSSTNHQHLHQQELSGSNGYPSAAGADGYHAYGAGYGSGGAYPADRMNPYAAHHAAYASAAAAGIQYGPDGGHMQHLKHEQQAAANNNHHNHHRELTASSGSSSASSIKMEHPNGAAHQYGSPQPNSAASTAPDRQQMHDDVRSPTGSTGSGDGTECEDDDNRGRRQQKKRGIFPKAATNIMRAWLFQHLNHPYPSEDQKKSLAEETGLTILQVNNWFINARRRIVQPMIDQSNRTSGNIMAGPAYSPDAGMGYMLDSSQPFRSLPGVDSSGMGPLASHAAMTSAMGAYSAASAQHLSQYGRSQQQHAAMLGLSTPPTGPHMMGAHPTLPHDPYY